MAMDALRQLAERCDVLTYEFERDVVLTGLMLSLGWTTPSSRADLLRISQNRIFEKDFCQMGSGHRISIQGVTTSQDSRYWPIEKHVLKTATGGYDGMGKVIRSEADLEEAYALADSTDCVLENSSTSTQKFPVIDDVWKWQGRYGFQFGKISTATTHPVLTRPSFYSPHFLIVLAEKRKPAGGANRRTAQAVWNPLRGDVCDSWWYHCQQCPTATQLWALLNRYLRLPLAVWYPYLGCSQTPIPAIHLHAPAVVCSMSSASMSDAEKYVWKSKLTSHLYGKLEASTKSRRWGMWLCLVIGGSKIRLRIWERDWFLGLPLWLKSLFMPMSKLWQRKTVVEVVFASLNEQAVYMINWLNWQNSFRMTILPLSDLPQDTDVPVGTFILWRLGRSFRRKIKMATLLTTVIVQFGTSK